MKIHEHNAGHMTKMAALPIYGKNSVKIFFSGTTGPTLMKLCMTLMKLCMNHQRPKPFIICANFAA